DLRAGQHGYERLARQALRLTTPGGLCLFASCSLHYDRAMMTDTLRSAARHTDRSLQMLWSHGAGLDHPVHPAIPETDYLKATLARVSPPGRGGAF
ncbi:MAG: RlmI/RlmK family 23S rRNA methyltransferase, partial [Pseudomonadota bacterium]|nr:RlmI/RlmK family 23S rRNA methyltransferase [Pseudomonadota bacterium]